MLKKISMAACAAITLSTATQAMAVPITYQGSLTIKNETANFSITTDGTLGSPLTASNILGYDFSITDNGQSIYGSDKLNGHLALSGTALTASSTQLFFNFNALGLFQLATSAPAGYFEYYSTQSLKVEEVGAPPYSDGGEKTYGVDFFGPANQVIANAVVAPTPSAVPEPATWGMMVVGFGAMGVVARRRRARGSVACA